MTTFYVQDVQLKQTKDIFVSFNSIVYIFLSLSSETGFDVENKLLITTFYYFLV